MLVPVESLISSPVHFLTIRVAGSLASERLDELRVWREEQLLLAPADPELAGRFRDRIQQRFFTEYDRLLDENRQHEPLANRHLAALVRRQLYQQQSVYAILAYAILPSHVHIVVQSRNDASPGLATPEAAHRGASGIPHRMDERDDAASPLVDYLRALKTATMNEAAELNHSGPPLLWHPGSFDYWVGSRAELEAIIEYVADNPISAGLVRSREQWFFCSAHDRFLHDGETCGWLPAAHGP